MLRRGTQDQLRHNAKGCCRAQHHRTEPQGLCIQRRHPSTSSLSHHRHAARLTQAGLRHLRSKWHIHTCPPRGTRRPAALGLRKDGSLSVVQTDPHRGKPQPFMDLDRNLPGRSHRLQPHRLWLLARSTLGPVPLAISSR